MSTTTTSSLETFKTMPHNVRQCFVENLTDTQRTAYLLDFIDYYHGFYTLRRKYGKDSWARRKQKRQGRESDDDKNQHVDKKQKTDRN